MSTIVPLISCICITRNRPQMLKQAVACFEAQTYPNKELVIVYEDDDQETEAYIIANGWSQWYRIITVDAKPKQTLGDLRNLAIREAGGKYICQWDDDDWYHVDRLMTQYNELLISGKQACVLSQWLMVDHYTRKIYLSSHRQWEGSLLCARDVLLKHPYPSLVQGEDTPVIRTLVTQKLLHTINNRAELYLYNYHGGNTWNREHWEHLFRYARLVTGLSPQLTDAMAIQTSTPESIAAILNTYKLTHPKFT